MSEKKKFGILRRRNGSGEFVRIPEKFFKDGKVNLDNTESIEYLIREGYDVKNSIDFRELTSKERKELIKKWEKNLEHLYYYDKEDLGISYNVGELEADIFKYTKTSPSRYTTRLYLTDTRRELLIMKYEKLITEILGL